MPVPCTIADYVIQIADRFKIVIPVEVSEKIIHYVYHRGERFPRKLLHSCDFILYEYEEPYMVQQSKEREERCQLARVETLSRAIKQHPLENFDEFAYSEEMWEKRHYEPKCEILGNRIASPLYPENDQENFDLKCVCIDMVRQSREYFKMYSALGGEQFYQKLDKWFYPVKFCSFIKIRHTMDVPILQIVLRDYEKQGMYPNIYNEGGRVKK